MTISYSRSLIWTRLLDGERVTYKVEGDSREEAAVELFAWALERQWTPPRWWEFWRWRDTRVTAGDVALLVKAAQQRTPAAPA